MPEAQKAPKLWPAEPWKVALTVLSGSPVPSAFPDPVERSIEAAVYKASPLPLPENSVLFDPILRFRFIPEQ